MSGIPRQRIGSRGNFPYRRGRRNWAQSLLRRTQMIQQQTGELATRPFNAAKVFSATMAQDRESLGDKVTAWIASNPRREIVDTVVTLSSDDAFHCLAITVFYRE